MKSGMLKKVAYSKLDGNWKILIISTIVYLLFNDTIGDAIDLYIDLKDMFFNNKGAVLDNYFLLSAIKTISGAISFFMLPVISIGYSRISLNLLEDKPIDKSILFEYLPTHFGKALGANILVGVYVLLWSLLLIIPGVMAAYSYSLVSYIMADNPDISIEAALSESKTLMEGNRMRLFLLDLSFIGWLLLSAFTFGLAALFIAPYYHTTVAAFYKEIKGVVGTSSQYTKIDGEIIYP